MTGGWGRWIERELDKRKWRPADAARQSGVPASAFSKWVGSGQNPSIDNVRKVAAVFGVPFLHAMVIAGLITPEEAEQSAAVRRADPDTLTDRELVMQVEKRLEEAAALRGVSLGPQQRQGHHDRGSFRKGPPLSEEGGRQGEAPDLVAGVNYPYPDEVDDTGQAGKRQRRPETG